MNKTSQRLRARLVAGAAATILSMMAGAAAAQTVASFNIAPQPLADALKEFGYQSGHGVLASPSLAQAKVTRGVRGEQDVELALNQLLDGSGLTWRRSGETFLIVDANAPQSGSAAGGGAEVDALIVTAQKKEEDIQDVPIAISAFSQKDLDAQKIEGGFDLLKAIPNVTFSKNNFTSYNFSIRGIGTKAVSVTTDPGVAVEFNSTALIRNRLFEQEYFDIERVEVLRGPQGTLHGRNATAGVINVISAKPDMNEFKGWLKGEVGNYHTKRLSAMVNVPLATDVLAVRLAGALTSRDGYDYNATTKNQVNGRDLWSARLSISYQPTDTLHADLIWERFNEDDDRSRTGKQLCKRDDGPHSITNPDNGAVMTFDLVDPGAKLLRGYMSQGCLPVSLYDKDAFQTPNGLSIPFIQAGGDFQNGLMGKDADGNTVAMLKLGVDPYGGMLQSQNLREFNSIHDPRYQAETDVVELNASYDLSSSLTFVSQTAWVKDRIYSFQDYNRFNTVPVIADSSKVVSDPAWVGVQGISPGGVFCDPQLGCSSSIAGFDISQAHSEQFSQEFRLQSSFDGPLNFGVGANYTRYKTDEDYYVLYNLITLLAQGMFTISNRSVDPRKCAMVSNGAEPLPFGAPGTERCIYVDPNPIESLDGEGHNYFRSKNPYKLKSYGLFGEMYWQASDALKFTLGLRYNDDNKQTTPYPTQVLLSTHPTLFGMVSKGYPADPDISQQWQEFTGRAGVDWKPELSFTNETLLYAFYSHGYKAGGMNPPGIGLNPEYNLLVDYPQTFEPEFVDAFEIGTKNTLLNGAMTFNATAYYYDYKDYQVSAIKDRTAINENFDSTAWGLEFETVFVPTERLRISGTLGYQDTAIADGEQSLDLMDRVRGTPGFVLMRPFLIQASSCVVPVQTLFQFGGPSAGYCGLPTAHFPYNWLHGPNDGVGFYADLGGNELPNAPHWTTSWGAQYSWDLLDGSWHATLRGDAYWQSQSWARVYNAVNDKLHGWYNANLSLWIENDDGLKVEIYAKNLLNDTPITDAFLNSDDTALTTNIFVLDPRLIGLSIRKEF